MKRFWFLVCLMLLAVPSWAVQRTPLAEAKSSPVLPSDSKPKENEAVSSPAWRAESTPAIQNERQSIPTGSGPAQSNSAPPQSSGSSTTLQLNVKSVLIPVVVRDGRGRAVSDLNKDSFQVFDNRESKALSGFVIERHAPSADATGLATEAPVSSQQSATDQILVLVFDDIHLSSDDLARSKSAVTPALDSLLADNRLIVVVSTSGTVNSGLTRDRKKLSDAIASVRPFQLMRPETIGCPKISYYQADLIVNKHDEDATQDMTRQMEALCFQVPIETRATMMSYMKQLAGQRARQQLNAGRRNELAMFASLTEFVRRMSGSPGRRTMVLISSGFFSFEPVVREAESRLVDLAAQSGVVVNVLDARGLFPSMPSAGEDFRGRDPEHSTSFLHEELTMASDAMTETALGTGGMFYHNSNDLKAGLNKLAEVPETVYLLEIPAEIAKRSGSYHSLTVKVDRADVQVQSRQGYFAPTK